jgi:hypothetical protein
VSGASRFLIDPVVVRRLAVGEPDRVARVLLYPAGTAKPTPDLTDAGVGVGLLLVILGTAVVHAVHLHRCRVRLTCSRVRHEHTGGRGPCDRGREVEPADQGEPLPVGQQLGQQGVLARAAPAVATWSCSAAVSKPPSARPNVAPSVAGQPVPGAIAMTTLPRACPVAMCRSAAGVSASGYVRSRTELSFPSSTSVLRIARSA